MTDRRDGRHRPPAHGSDKRVEADPVRMRPDDSEVRLLLADSARLRAATGWQPRVSLEEGLKRTVAWWRARMAQGTGCVAPADT